MHRHINMYQNRPIHFTFTLAHDIKFIEIYMSNHIGRVKNKMIDIFSFHIEVIIALIMAMDICMKFMMKFKLSIHGLGGGQMKDINISRRF